VKKDELFYITMHLSYIDEKIVPTRFKHYKNIR